MNIELLRAEYAAGGSIESVLVEIHERITQRGDDAVWMHLEAREECLTSPSFTDPGIEVERWGLTPEALGELVAQVPPPMVISTPELEDGSTCKGFLCEPYALDGANEITPFGGWRSYLSLGK